MTSAREPGPRPRPTGERIAGLPTGPALAGALFAWGVAGAAPTVDWLDSGNLVASAWTMGVAHPPGEPAWLALARVAELVPVGDVAFRVNVLSAACVAGCVFPLLAACRFAGRRPDDREAPAALPAAAPLLVAAALLGYGARMQAVRAEVYGLTALLMAAALAAALRLRGARSSASIGLLLGLGAAVHPLLCAVAVPGLAIARLAGSRLRLRDLGWTAGAGLWGFAAYAWLPLRARAVPGRSWGIPDDPAAFVDVLLARTFARNFGGEQAGGVLDNLPVVLSLWSRAGLPILLALGVAAAVPWRGRRAAAGVPALAVATALWLVGNAWTVLPQNKVFASNPDLLGYLLVGVLGAVPLAAVGVHRLGRVGALVAGLLLLAQGTLGMTASRPQGHGARAFAVAQSAGLPPGSVLVPSGNDTAFTWTWLQAVERRRADLLVMPRVLMGHPHELARLGGQVRLAGLGIPWTAALQGDPASTLRASRRPVFVEVREPELPHLRSGLLVRHGLVATLVRPPGPGAPPCAEGRWLGEVRATTLAELDEPRHLADAQGALVLLYYRSLWGEGDR